MTRASEIFCLAKSLVGCDQLLLALLVFDLRPERVDRRSDAGLLLRDRLVVERLRGFDLGLRGFHARCSGNRLQIGVAGREHDQIARILQIELGHAFADHRGAVFLDRLPVEDALRRRSAHVEVGERPDDTRKGNPGNSDPLKPRACRLSFCATSCTSPLTFGSRSLSCCHFSPRASMVLYSEKRPARFWRNARSMAPLKVSGRTPGWAWPPARCQTLDSGPRFDLRSGIGPPAANSPNGEEANSARQATLPGQLTRSTKGAARTRVAIN
jgi:hypothetical protein